MSRLLNPATRSPSQATEGVRSRLTSSRLCPDWAGWTVPEQHWCHWCRARVVLRPASLGRNLRPCRLEPPAGDLWSGGSGPLVDDRAVRWLALRAGDRTIRSLGVPLLVAGHHLGALGVSSDAQHGGVEVVAVEGFLVEPQVRRCPSSDSSGSISRMRSHGSVSMSFFHSAWHSGRYPPFCVVQRSMLSSPIRMFTSATALRHTHFPSHCPAAHRPGSRG